MTLNIKSALQDFNIQKREMNFLKKHEQQTNFEKHKRVQSAYKKLLMDRLKEKNERTKQLSEKKTKIQNFTLNNSSSLRTAFFNNPAVTGQIPQLDEGTIKEIRNKIFKKEKKD